MFQCSYCPRTFDKEVNLEVHVRLGHPAKSDEQSLLPPSMPDLKCPHCPEEFADFGLWSVHFREAHPDLVPELPTPLADMGEAFKDYGNMMNRWASNTQFQSAASIASSLTNTYLASNGAKFTTEGQVLDIFDRMYRSILQRFLGEPDQGEQPTQSQTSDDQD